jgi:quercetin dioxygenase-like cupin family protein
MHDCDEVILKTDDALVRILTLEGGQATSWHFHTEVTDKMLCLKGRIVIEQQGPQERVVLCPGGRCEVTVERVHRVVNQGTETAQYLLVQGVGRYDFNVVDETALLGE